MNLTFNKSDLTQYFLSPISKLTERCSVIISKDGLSALATTEERNPILYSQYMCSTGIQDDAEQTLNIPDIKRLITAISCIPDDTITFTINSNNIECNQSGIKFKYHLLEDGTLPKEIVSREKIGQLAFESHFKLKSNNITDIIKGTSFAINTDKVYFYMKDSYVFAALTDNEMANVDSMVIHLTDTYTGNDIKSPLPIKVEILKLFGGMKCDVDVSVNTQNKILLFKIENNVYKLQYIVSSLIK